MIIMIQIKKKARIYSNHKILVSARFLHLIFPDLVCETAYELFYSRLGQHISIGNYWNDPHHQVTILILTYFIY